MFAGQATINSKLNRDNRVPNFTNSSFKKKYDISSKNITAKSLKPIFNEEHKNDNSHIKEKTQNILPKNDVIQKNMNYLKNLSGKNSHAPSGDKVVDNVVADLQLSEFENSRKDLEKEEFKRKPTSNSLRKRKKKRENKDDIGSITHFILKQKSKFFEERKLGDTKKYDNLIEQYRYNIIMQSFFSFISICSVFLEYEISFLNNTKDGITMISGSTPYESTRKDYLSSLHWFVLWIHLISSILLWVTIIFEFFIESEIISYHKKLDKHLIRTEKSSIIHLILQLILFLAHPNPAFKDIKFRYYSYKFNIDAHYTINSILGIFCLFRLWFTIKLYLVKSKYMNPRSHRICEMNRFDINFAYIMKANMNKIPLVMYTLFFVNILVFCSFSLRVFERDLDDHTLKNFSSYFNVLWCIVITMTTVGYGDYFPSTIFGRLIMIFACISGVFLISMLVVSVTNLLNFEEGEKTAFLLLDRISLNEKKQDIAASLIMKYIRLLHALKSGKYNKNDGKIIYMRDDFLLNLVELREINREYEMTFPPDTEFDKILDEMEDLDFQLSDLLQDFDKSFQQ
jgi:hypothetical protein